MAKILSDRTAEQLTVLLHTSRLGSRQAYTRPGDRTVRPAPWAVRWSAANADYTVYIPAHALIGHDLDLSALSQAKESADPQAAGLPDWYLTGAGTDATRITAVIGSDYTLTLAGEPPSSSSEALATVTLAAVRRHPATPDLPEHHTVDQLVLGAISLGSTEGGGGGGGSVLPDGMLIPGEVRYIVTETPGQSYRDPPTVTAKLVQEILRWDAATQTFIPEPEPRLITDLESHLLDHGASDVPESEQPQEPTGV